MKHSHVKQAGLTATRVTGKYAAYSKAASAEGVVVAVHYVDDATNKSKTHVEYDVKDLRTGQIYPNVRRGEGAAGLQDGDETILRAAKQVDGSNEFDVASSQLSKSDGDWVSLSFSYGAQHGAVISGVLPHPKTEYGAKRSDGQRRFTTHKGTTLEFKDDGSFVVTRAGTSFAIESDDEVVITHKSGSRLRFLDNGDVDVVPQRNLLLGGTTLTPVDGVVHGTGIDTFSGLTHFALGSTSRTTLVKK